MPLTAEKIAEINHNILYWERKAKTLFAEKEYLENLKLLVPDRITTQLIHANDMAIEQRNKLDENKTDNLNG